MLNGTYTTGEGETALYDPKGDLLTFLWFSLAAAGRADVAMARDGVEKSMLNVKVKRSSAATFISISEVDEQAPLYQVRNLSAAHVVHVWQPSPRVKGTALAVSVGPGKGC